ncbi:hypothetical protein FPV67DRAFT_1563422 [Lyophyllum atratum]|nr:hypothetical protein FPV67DRAFT_1563422 [Lyophyllum atratum]
MDLDPNNPTTAYNQTCICNRTFSSPAAFKNHENTCSAKKQNLSEVLANVKKRRAQKILASTATGHSVQATEPHTGEESGLAGPIDEGNTGPTRGQQLNETTPSNDDHSSQADPPPAKRHRMLPVHLRSSSFIMHDKTLRDVLPQPLAPVSGAAAGSIPTPVSGRVLPATYESLGSITPSTREAAPIDTGKNEFGMFRRYHHRSLPSHDPEAQANITTLSNIQPAMVSAKRLPAYGPYPNENAFKLGDWFWNDGAQKSQESFRRLVEIVGSETFVPAELGLNDWDQEEWEDEDAGWHESSVKIRVPFHRHIKLHGVRDFIVKAFYRRSLVSVIREKLTLKKPDLPHFHTEPYELLWQPNAEDDPVRLHGDLYTSPAFLKAHQELQNSPTEPGCNLPRVVVALMFWSDGTHLTDFGNANLTPVYMYFGNESKYRRCKPTCNLAEHVAYLQELPDEFKDFVSHYTGKKKIDPDLMTHCRRELFHAQWRLLLDDEFVHAYQHGLVIQWEDGTARRFYPRILTYSADYKEKAVVATIRQNGAFPCPRCKMPLSDMHLFGTKKDRQTRIKLDAYVERQLKPESLVPTLNAFADRLGPELLGLNWFNMFVVDLLHEVELGIWKALFIHLLRILDSLDQTLLHELDRRFRLVPTFGRDTIRRFSRNSSEMKKMAARDFEDLLQCSIPVFEGLIPEPHNSPILDLLFHFAHWHGLAKLRVHSDLTLEILDKETTFLGDSLRGFQTNVCGSFQTHELAREAEARRRAEENRNKTKAVTPVAFNLNRYKAHAFGDYVATIKQYGTTDSYSTESGELEHRVPKGNYKRTSKKQFQKQLAQIERRQSRLRRIKQKLMNLGSQPAVAVSGGAPAAIFGAMGSPQQDSDSATSTSGGNATAHHHIGTSENLPEHVGTFLQVHAGDPATKFFLKDLRAHLLPRLKSILQLPSDNHPAIIDSDSPSFSLDAETVYLRKDLMYRHNLLRVNYTTYDVRRAQDTLNPRTDHRDIMLLSTDNNSVHKYRYARIIGIFHANAIYSGPGRRAQGSAHRLEFLWVRWFQLEDEVPPATAWSRRKLDRLRFVGMDQPHAFGFVDPADVLRGCHLIPRFSLERRHSDRIGLSGCAQDGDDWRAYFVNRFVDRDMVMRYHWGLGVGHVYSRQATQAPPTQPNTSGPSSQPGKGRETDLDVYIDIDAEDAVPTLPLCPGTGTADSAPAGDHSADSEDNEIEDSKPQGNSSSDDEDSNIIGASDFEGDGDSDSDHSSDGDSQGEYLDEMYGEFSDNAVTSFD